MKKPLILTLFLSVSSIFICSEVVKGPLFQYTLVGEISRGTWEDGPATSIGIYAKVGAEGKSVSIAIREGCYLEVAVLKEYLIGTQDAIELADAISACIPFTYGNHPKGEVEKVAPINVIDLKKNVFTILFNLHKAGRSVNGCVVLGYIAPELSTANDRHVSICTSLAPKNVCKQLEKLCSYLRKAADIVDRSKE